MVHTSVTDYRKCENCTVLQDSDMAPRRLVQQSRMLHTGYTKNACLSSGMSYLLKHAEAPMRENVTFRDAVHRVSWLLPNCTPPPPNFLMTHPPNF